MAIVLLGERRSGNLPVYKNAMVTPLSVDSRSVDAGSTKAIRISFVLEFSSLLLPQLTAAIGRQV
jgi:hypothetical protein